MDFSGSCCKVKIDECLYQVFCKSDLCCVHTKGKANFRLALLTWVWLLDHLFAFKNILQPLDSSRPFARILFVDFSCRWITDFLSDRKQHVKLGKYVPSKLEMFQYHFFLPNTNSDIWRCQNLSSIQLLKNNNNTNSSWYPAGNWCRHGGRPVYYPMPVHWLAGCLAEEIHMAGIAASI